MSDKPIVITMGDPSGVGAEVIVKAMAAAWGEKVGQGDLYQLFPGDPSKQGGRIAGLPESRRKGGY